MYCQTWASSAGFVSLNKLIYTVVDSPGYFAQLSAWPLVGMFGILLALDLICLKFGGLK